MVVRGGGASGMEAGAEEGRADEGLCGSQSLSLSDYPYDTKGVEVE